MTPTYQWPVPQLSERWQQVCRDANRSHEQIHIARLSEHQQSNGSHFRYPQKSPGRGMRTRARSYATLEAGTMRISYHGWQYTCNVVSGEKARRGEATQS